jgi:acyl carrier protein
MDNSIKEKVFEIFKDVLEIQSVSPDMTMDNTVQWDSLRQLALVTEIETQFSIDLEFDDILQMTAIGTIIEIVEKYMNGKQ